ncbi:MAG: VWA domain-containing protein, partial [Myxococcaceae bacterium]|nr:VWA domain-containing protein [Myxococcaceae bacterium]
KGLEGRASAALQAFRAELDRLERLLAAGAPVPGAAERLEADFVRLARALKVADVFAAASESPGTFELLPRRASALVPPPGAPRLAVAEFLLERARQSPDDVARKRRDVELAHELLLRSAVESEADRERYREARDAAASARQRVRAAPVVRSVADLARHVRLSARRSPEQAYRALKGLYERAVEAQDAPLAEAAHAAVRAVIPGPAAVAQALERDERLRAAGLELPGPEALPPGGKASPHELADDLLAELAFDLDADQRAALELAAGLSRYFDVEDALAEPLVEAALAEARPAPRRVGWPTQTMTYEFASGLDELGNFVIHHPRMLLYDLAANRQPVRAYLEDAPEGARRQVRKTAVRVYVLDASGSMHGQRARFRDALLIAELNAIRVKARAQLPFDPLYFSFFNDVPTDLERVDDAGAALLHINRLFRESPARGQTDITLALGSAFESIRKARGRDPYLARATVVLVTDGEDHLDPAVIRQLQGPVEGVQIALSFVSLGEENPDLKQLAHEQRAKGSRAFYQHLSDPELESVRTAFDRGFRTLLPDSVPLSPALLEQLLPHLEALEAIGRGRGLSAPVHGPQQFAAFFPERSPAFDGGQEADGERVADILAAVADAVSLAPADDRAAEAVTLLQHLLALYGLPTSRWPALLEGAAPRARAPYEQLRLVCAPFTAPGP